MLLYFNYTSINLTSKKLCWGGVRYKLVLCDDIGGKTPAYSLIALFQYSIKNSDHDTSKYIELKVNKNTTYKSYEMWI